MKLKETKADKLLRICKIDDFVRRGDEYVLRCAGEEDIIPSCRLNVEGFWKCFSCGNHGNHIDFLVRRLNISRSEAKRNFGEGLIRISDIEQQLVSRREKRREKLIPEQIFVEHSIPAMWQKPYGKYLQYLNGRGIWGRIIKKFDLWIGNDCGNSRFNRRIIFPVTFRRKIIGWTSRTVAGEARIKKYRLKKYRNSIGFPKQYALYGYDQYKETFPNTVILVEGPMDVLKLHQAGVGCCLGCFNAEVSESQVELIQRLGVTTIVVAFDHDAAGYRGFKEFCRNFGDEFEIFRWHFWKRRDVNDVGEMELDELKSLCKREYFVQPSKIDDIMEMMG